MAELLAEKWKSLNAVSTGIGGSRQFNGLTREVVAVLTPAGAVTGGTVVLEEAAETSDANTWSQIGAFSTPATSTTQALHVTGCFMAVRARITSNITGGGTVSVDIAGN